MSERYVAGFIQAGAFNPLTPRNSGYLYNLYSWGSNAFGQLGTGNLTYFSSPSQVGSLTNWAAISIGGTAPTAGAFTLAIKTDGTLWSWGKNDSGQLGLGNLTYYSSPKQVGALTNWSSISTGALFGVAIKTNGTLWTWGFNSAGQLGLGNRTYYSSPKQVGALTNWQSISCAASSIAAIQTDGTLWTWGLNNAGALGRNNTTSYSSPKQVGSLTNWKTFSSTGYGNYFLAVKTDGTLWAWGTNGQGELGTGNITYYSSPKQIGALTSWLSVASTYHSSMAVKTDGTLWSWGKNNNGQLGTSNLTYYSSPKQVGALTNWSSKITMSLNNGYAIKTDGTLWSWGNGAYGQLGIGNRTSYSSPKQIGASTTWNLIKANASSVLALG
jgi:alpha-tubulin suppressor-like RCC1 family protein